MISGLNPYRLIWLGNEDGTERLENGRHIGWVLLVDVPLPEEPLKRAIDWAITQYKGIFRGLPHGDRREALGKQLMLLERYRVIQGVDDSESDGTLFQSTERTNPDRIIFDYGGKS